ncbi:hypothetical protein ScPMuIL_010831 [Solemya velum]
MQTVRGCVRPIEWYSFWQQQDKLDPICEMNVKQQASVNWTILAVLKCLRLFHRMSDRLIVAALDFGTTYSGYAFSFRHDYESQPQKICTNTAWIASGQGLVSWKTPTTVLLNPDKTFDSFGYKAEEKYAELAEEEEHEEWYYFSRFKMMLHNKLGLKRDISLEDANGKQMPANTIFTMALKFLADHVMETLHSRSIDVRKKDVHWVLTVPAIWNEPAKQFMREVAVKAGIESCDLTLALEPEAAALYCQITKVVRSVSNDGKESFGPLKPGTKYMVLDLGGGTVDVTVHEVLDDDTLKEIIKASGGAWGGTKVDEGFSKTMQELLDSDNRHVYQEFSRQYKSDFLELQRDFELKKRTITEETNKIHIRIPVSLCTLLRDMRDLTMEEAVKKSSFAEKMTFKRDRIHMSGAIMRKMFEQPISSILNHTCHLLEKCNDIRYILMIGGFAESKLVREAIQRDFPDIQVITPDDPGLCVVKGAVLFGHKPAAISSRISKCTYGVAVHGDFISGVHPENKKEVVGNEVICKDVFSKFVEISKDVAVGDRVSKTYDVTCRESSVIVSVFASSKPYPILTTDKDSSKLGDITIHPPEDGWPQNAKIEVDMWFGGTEFNVQATDAATKKSYSTTFDFLN